MSARVSTTSWTFTFVALFIQCRHILCTQRKLFIDEIYRDYLTRSYRDILFKSLPTTMSLAIGPKYREITKTYTAHCKLLITVIPLIIRYSYNTFLFYAISVSRIIIHPYSRYNAGISHVTCISVL